jgi:poly(3-hydroxybutyrate) depolymerase
LRFHIIENGGHTWPGGPVLGVTNNDISTSELIWAFVDRHSLP